MREDRGKRKREGSEREMTGRQREREGGAEGTQGREEKKREGAKERWKDGAKKCKERKEWHCWVLIMLKYM